MLITRADQIVAGARILRRVARRLILRAGNRRGCAHPAGVAKVGLGSIVAKRGEDARDG